MGSRVASILYPGMDLRPDPSAIKWKFKVEDGKEDKRREERDCLRPQFVEISDRSLIQFA